MPREDDLLDVSSSRGAGSSGAPDAGAWFLADDEVGFGPLAGEEKVGPLSGAGLPDSQGGYRPHDSPGQTGWEPPSVRPRLDTLDRGRRLSVSSIPAGRWLKNARAGRVVPVAIAIAVLGAIVLVSRTAGSPDGSEAAGSEQSATPSPSDFTLGPTCWATHYGAEIPPHSFTASGDAFNAQALTAATSLGRSPQLPFGTLVRVQNVANGKTVTVRINDRGSFTGTAAEPKCLDLTDGAFKKLGSLNPDPGHLTVTETVLSPGMKEAVASPSPTVTPVKHASPSPSPTRSSSASPTRSPTKAAPTPVASIPQRAPTPSKPRANPKDAGRSGHVKGISGKCIGLSSNPSPSGAPVELLTCANEATQQWTYSTSGTLRLEGLCLDVTWSGRTDGTPVQLWSCNGTAAQKWQARTDGELINANSGLCLDVKDKHTSDGTPLQVWSCWDGRNQKWEMP
ncbi:ricin-type beta-trefoil lectin domain protein [Streptomyces sp. NBC_01497]|uniref:ricin-type beta-trefoil lectin domain protein n=1 Tax=Streptomyces sp. NBC_01497 TaxID=2903885 RepID=UPI002E379491|nr:ricin-type beta-trefoil lectin domain protein [Streptomyces sp. NBC_01497]